jgi:hypothetical protein
VRPEVVAGVVGRRRVWRTRKNQMYYSSDHARALRVTGAWRYCHALTLRHRTVSHYLQS